MLMWLMLCVCAGVLAGASGVVVDDGVSDAVVVAVVADDADVAVGVNVVV